MAEISWGWTNPGNGQSAIGMDPGTTFDNSNTGQTEGATSQGGVGNPYATSPTGNYGDPHWNQQDQQYYSLLMTQGRNQEAGAFGQQAWNRSNSNRQPASGGGGGGAATKGYTGSVYDNHTGTYSVFDPTAKKWSDGLTRDAMLAGANEKYKNSQPAWQWQQQEDQSNGQGFNRSMNEAISTPRVKQAQFSSF